MQRKLLITAAAGALLLVASCGPRQAANIEPEVVYDKYGNATYSGCVPAGQRASSGQSNLPTCAPPPSGCRAGEQSATNASGQQVCVPIREKDEEPNEPNEPNEPTGQEIN